MYTLWEIYSGYTVHCEKFTLGILHTVRNLLWEYYTVHCEKFTLGILCILWEIYSWYTAHCTMWEITLSILHNVKNLLWVYCILYSVSVYYEKFTLGIPFTVRKLLLVYCTVQCTLWEIYSGYTVNREKKITLGKLCTL